MPTRRLFVALFISLAVLLAAGLIAASAGAQAESDDSSAVVLAPGENLVGWVGASQSTAQLRQETPAIESIQQWDPRSQELIDAESLEAGKGYVITLSGRRSVTFRRPMMPVLGKVELKRGRNLVAWLGPDDWPIDRVALGIGRSLIQAEWNGATYRPARNQSTDSLPTVKRGDALWIEASRNLNWLQPAGVMPRLVFAGEASAELQVEVSRDSEDVMNYFADEFALQPDGSMLTVYAAAGLSELIDAFEADGVSTSDVHRLWYTAGGWASPSGHIVLKLEQWGPDYNVSGNQDGEYGYGRYVLAHEYYHAIQQQMSGTNAAQWLIEGGAEWAEAGVRSMDAESSLHEALASSRNSASSQHAPPLDHTERDVENWQYTLGALASHQLELRSGEQALLEFWRSLLPEPLGPLGRWQSKPPWQQVFHDVFGLSVQEFYEDFAAWRGELIPTALRGRVLGPDGKGLPYVEVVGQSPRLESDYHDYHSTTTDQDGNFELAVSELGFAKVGVDLGGCEVYYTSNGLVSAWYQAEELNTTDRAFENLQLRLSNDICVWQVQGRVTDAEGNGVGEQWLNLTGDNGGSAGVRTAGDGTFAATMPFTGRYTLSTWIDDCSAYYGLDGTVGSQSRATRLEVENGDVTDIAFQLREGLCSTKIAGRLLDAAGEAIVNTHVSANSDTGDSAGDRTDSDGAFAIALPDTGTYSLSVGVNGCTVYYRHGGATAAYDQRTRITVKERGITGIRFQLRRGQCSTKISGRVLDAAGEPIADASVWALNVDSSSWASTDANGAYAITLPAAGQYRVSASIDGCTIYHRRNGVTGRRNQATQLRVAYSDLTGVTLALSDGVCEYRISGRLVNGDGTPRSREWVSASSVVGNAGAWTTADGSFSFAVPANGSYRLSVWIDGCWNYHGSGGPAKNWNSASQVRVLNADATDIVFRLPEDPSSFCD